MMNYFKFDPYEYTNGDETTNVFREKYKNSLYRIMYRLKNPYLRRFHYGGIKKQIRKNTQRYKMFKKKQTYKRDKEITEAMAVIRVLMDSDNQPQIVFDIGSGVGFFSQIFADMNTTRNNHIYAMDINEEINAEHFDAIRNACFTNIDVYDDEFRRFLLKRIQDNNVIVGIHLCKSLAFKFVDIFHEYDEIDMMILSPCCSTGTYNDWCESLLQRVKVEYTPYFYYDNNIMSVKNGVLVARRR